MEAPWGLPQWSFWDIYVLKDHRALMSTQQVVSYMRAFASTHPTSKIDLLFFTARARHFPPSLVILFSPSLQREVCTCQPPAVRGLQCHRAPLALLGVWLLMRPQQPCPDLPFREGPEA